MNKIDVIRAWKDPAYRNSLTAAERTGLPENPAGVVELTLQHAASVVGGDMTHPITFPVWSHCPCTMRYVCGGPVPMI